MRLIDADGLTMNCKVHISESDARILEDALNRMLNNAPTIEAEPVRHGHWIVSNKSSWSQCSVCKRHFLYVWDYENADWYCRHCGAKMDEPMEVIDDEKRK